MATRLYVEQENGNLKFIEEVEGADGRPDLALDAVLDENPRLKNTAYVAVTGDLDDGTVCVLEVTDDEPVNPRRGIAVSTSKSAPGPRKRRNNPKAAPEPEVEDEEVEDEEEEIEEEPAPAPKRKPARRSAAKKTAAKSGKAATKKAPAKKTAGKKGASPFKKSDKGDE